MKKKTTIESIVGIENTENLSEKEFKRKIDIHNMLLRYIKAGVFDK